MSKDKASQDPNNGQKKRTVRSYPSNTLEDVLVIATAIQEKNAGKPMKRIFVADAIGRTPDSSAFRRMLSSSIRYGLTTGGEQAEYIDLTQLGQSVTKPRSSEEKGKALQQASLQPELFKKIYEYYKDSKIPTGDFFKNVVEREFGVNRELVEDCIRILMENGRFARIIQDIAGAPRIVFGTFTDTLSSDDEIEEEPVDSSTPEALPTPPNPPAPEIRQIFVAHGKNRHPLEQLKKILEQFHVPFKVAVDEPHKGRPISSKVAELMKSCSSAIFIFTADEEYQDAQGNKVMKPSDNVVYELGAATVLYGNKIVIFKDEGVDFATDFKDFGYITFQKDNLEAKAMDLMKELIAFGLLKVTPA